MEHAYRLPSLRKTCYNCNSVILQGPYSISPFFEEAPNDKTFKFDGSSSTPKHCPYCGMALPEYTDIEHVFPLFKRYAESDSFDFLNIGIDWLGLNGFEETADERPSHGTRILRWKRSDGYVIQFVVSGIHSSLKGGVELFKEEEDV